MIEPPYRVTITTEYIMPDHPYPDDFHTAEFWQNETSRENDWLKERGTPAKIFQLDEHYDEETDATLAVLTYEFGDMEDAAMFKLLFG